MNPVKLKARASELKDAIENGDCETIDGVYTPAERKEIKKRWPLLWDLLQNIEEQIAVVNDSQDDLLNQIEMLELVSEARCIVDQRDFDAPEFDPPREDEGDEDEGEPEIEVVDAVPITEGD